MLLAPTSDAELLLKTAQPYSMGDPTTQEPIGSRLDQNLSRIHVNYGDSLDPTTRAQDPFYLLNELFQQDARSESQQLDLVTYKISRHMIGAGVDLMETPDYKILQSELLHFQSFLEEQIERLQYKLSLIRRRGGSSWPRSKDEHVGRVTDAAILTLTEDFNRLLERAHNLLMKIERSLSLRMSIVNIEDARRGIEQNSTLFRFTVVASIYIPLSFTTSFFGMNFHQLSKDLSIWIFFATSAPVFALSILCLFIRRSWVEDFQRMLNIGVRRRSR